MKFADYQRVFAVKRHPFLRTVCHPGQLFSYMITRCSVISCGVAFVALSEWLWWGELLLPQPGLGLFIILASKKQFRPSQV